VASYFTHPRSIGLSSLNLEDDAQRSGWAISEIKRAGALQNSLLTLAPALTEVIFAF